MARTKQEIFDEVIAKRDADAVLSPVLTSNSKAAFHIAIAVLYSELTSEFEGNFDTFTAEVEALLEEKQVMNKAWWRIQSLGFQLGDNLSIDDSGNLFYSIIDETKQIIERVAVTSPSEARVTLKVAKLVSGSAVPLSATEKTAFESYTDEIAPVGIVPNVVSEAGDELQLNADIEIDTQIIDINTGARLDDATVFPVEDAINNYIATFQEFDFGGTFFASRLLNAILGTEGVANAVLNTVEKKSAGDVSFIDVLALSGKKFETFSGYVRLADGFTLADNLNYS